MRGGNGHLQSDAERLLGAGQEMKTLEGRKVQTTGYYSSRSSAQRWRMTGAYDWTLTCRSVQFRYGKNRTINLQ